MTNDSDTTDLPKRGRLTRWLGVLDRRDWLLALALLMAFASCRTAANARALAEQAVDQSDAAEGEAQRANEAAEQATSDVDDIKYRLRMP